MTAPWFGPPPAPPPAPRLCEPEADWYGRPYSDDCPACDHPYTLHRRTHECLWCVLVERINRTLEPFESRL